MLDVVAGGSAVIERGGKQDPVISPYPYATPGDFAAQYPVPLDTTELIAMCEEVTLLNWLRPTEEETGLKQLAWRELNELAFTSGTSYVSFADGDCPDEFRHDGDNSTYDMHNIGLKKTLSLSDIKHSAASRAAGVGMAALSGPTPYGEMLPYSGQDTTMGAVLAIADIKAKEIALGTTLLLNAWDYLLWNGNHSNNSLEFDGIAKQLASGSGAHANSNTASGTFSATAFDRFLGEGCAKPTVLVAAPQAAQEILSAYFVLGFSGSQIIGLNNQERITPGFNFAAAVNTAVGRLGIVADSNIPVTAFGGTSFQTNVYGLRMTHNGAKLIYMTTQIPLGYQDLAPGCNTVSFQIWAKTGVVVKHKCAHHVYTSQFTGRITTTCPVII